METNTEYADQQYDIRFTAPIPPPSSTPYSKQYDIRYFQKSDGTWVNLVEYCTLMKQKFPNLQIYIGTDSQYVNGNANYAVVVVFRGNQEGEIDAKKGAHALHKKFMERLVLQEKREHTEVKTLIANGQSLRQVLELGYKVYRLEEMGFNISSDLKKEFTKKQRRRKTNSKGKNDREIEERLKRETQISICAAVQIEHIGNVKINSIEIDCDSKLIKDESGKMIPMVASNKSAKVVTECMGMGASNGFIVNAKTYQNDRKTVLKVMIATPYADILCRT